MAGIIVGRRQPAGDQFQQRHGLAAPTVSHEATKATKSLSVKIFVIFVPS